MISIEFRQVCLVVNRGDQGAEVAFPDTGHVLFLGDKEISGLIELKASDGTTAATAPPDRDWVPLVGDVAGTPLRAKRRNELAGMRKCRSVFTVTGGGWVTGRAIPPSPGNPDYGNSMWSHGTWRGRLTNWVRWELNDLRGRTYRLEKNGQEFLTLKDGDQLILTNRDKEIPDTENGDSAFADDFDLLFDFVNGPAARPVRPRTDRIKVPVVSPKLPLCPVGQTEGA